MAEIAVADVVVDPPAMKCERAGDVVVGRDSAVAVLEGRLAVVAAAAVQGDQTIVALPVYGASAAKNAGSAIGVEIASGLTRKETARDEPVEGVATGGAAHTPDHDTLHVVV